MAGLEPEKLHVFDNLEMLSQHEDFCCFPAV